MCELAASSVGSAVAFVPRELVPSGCDGKASDARGERAGSGTASGPVHSWGRVVLQVPSEDTAQPLTDFRNGSCIRLLSSALTSARFACSLDRWVCRRTVNIPLERLRLADMGKAQEVERLGLALPPASAVAIGKGAELKEPRLIRMQFQTERAKRSRSAARKASASVLFWNPTMKSSA